MILVFLILCFVPAFSPLWETEAGPLVKAPGRGWVRASVLRVERPWADCNLRETGASDLMSGPLPLWTGESRGAAAWCSSRRRDSEALLVPLGVGSWAGLNHSALGQPPGEVGRHQSPVAGSPSAPSWGSAPSTRTWAETAAQPPTPPAGPTARDTRA